MTKLKNGMELICAPNPKTEFCSFALFFRAGTFYETGEKRGISHLIQNLFLMNCNGVSKPDLYHAVESIGAEVRAKTHRDLVSIEITVLSEYFSQAFDMIYGILSPFSWKEQEIQKQVKIIKKYIDLKQETFSEEMERLYFHHPKYNAGIMGTYETLDALSAGEINAFKRKYFGCSNACLTVAGNYRQSDWEKAVCRLEELPQSEPVVPKRVLPSDLFRRTEKSDAVFPTDGDYSDVWMTFDVNTDQLDFDQVEYLVSMLGGGMGGRLPFALIDSHAVTDAVSTQLTGYDGFAAIWIDYRVMNVDLPDSLELLLGEIRAFQNTLSERDCDCALPFFAQNAVRDAHNTEKLAYQTGLYHFVFHREYDNVRFLNAVQSVTVAQLRQTAQQIFRPENLTVHAYNNSRIVPKRAVTALLQKWRREW